MNMNNSSILVSIGIPTFNRCELLQKSVHAVLDQDYPNLEIVISDNASTDTTQAICQEISTHDRRVRYIRQSHNLGVIGNLKAVLQESSGQLFMWFPDDYLIPPNYIEACVEEFSKDPALALVVGQGKYLIDNQYAFDCTDYNCLDENPQQRLFSFYSQFRQDLTAFYGLTKRILLTRIFLKEDGAENQAHKIFDTSIGADVRIFAELAFLGKIKTIYTTNVYRNELSSKTSDSRYYKNLAQGCGVPEFQADHVSETHAVTCFADVAYHSSTYKPLGTMGRWLTAWEVLKHLMRLYQINLLRDLNFPDFYISMIGSDVEYKNLSVSLNEACNDFLSLAFNTYYQFNRGFQYLSSTDLDEIHSVFVIYQCLDTLMTWTRVCGLLHSAETCSIKSWLIDFYRYMIKKSPSQAQNYIALSRLYEMQERHTASNKSACLAKIYQSIMAG